jgi:hypothetical protein
MKLGYATCTVIRSCDGGWEGSGLVGSQAAYVASRRSTRKVSEIEVQRGKVKRERRKRKPRGMKASGDRKMRTAKCEKRDWIPSDVMLFFSLYLRRHRTFYYFLFLFEVYIKNLGYLNLVEV